MATLLPEAASDRSGAGAHGYPQLKLSETAVQASCQGMWPMPFAVENVLRRPGGAPAAVRGAPEEPRGPQPASGPGSIFRGAGAAMDPYFGAREPLVSQDDNCRQGHQRSACGCGWPQPETEA
jgi:hypothetical protein